MSETCQFSITQGPRWRWYRAEEMILADQRGESSEGPQDFYVHLAYRLGKFASHYHGKQWARAKWPVMWDVYQIGTDPKRYKTSRVAIEACLLSGLTPDETADKLLWTTPLHVSLYSKWFFDLSGIAKSPTWVEDYILAPYKKSEKAENWVVALVLASQGLIEDALTYVLTGKAPDLSVLKEFRKNERTKYTVNYIMKGINLPAELAAPIVENVIKIDDEVDRASEKELTKAGISLSEAEIAQLQSATEKYADSQAGKYSTGPNGVEELPGMSEVRERWQQLENKDDKNE